MPEREESGMCGGQVISQRCFPERFDWAKGLVEEDEVVCSGVELSGRGNMVVGSLGSGPRCWVFRFLAVVGVTVGGKRVVKEASESESESELEIEEVEAEE